MPFVKGREEGSRYLPFLRFVALDGADVVAPFGLLCYKQNKLSIYLC